MFNICFECGKFAETENHHVIPQSLGGNNTVKLCLDCHCSVHNSKFRKDSHVALIKQGLNKAKQRGVKLGRKKGSMSKESFLNKYKKVIIELQQGLSIRKTAKKFDLGISTIQRIKNKLKNEQN